MRRSRTSLGTPCALLFALAISACQPDPCAELVDRTCGADDACAASAGCRNARQLLEASTEPACREALDNPISYPECRI